MNASVAAVVVHHRRFPEVLQTVRSLVDAGVGEDSLVVVDNSELPAVAERLDESARGWRVHHMPNRGYGAAANAGAALLPQSDVVLVVTHEVRIDAGSLARLVKTVISEPDVAAAGPALLLAEDGTVWSRGGLLTRRLRLPLQIVKEEPEAAAVHEVDWLDGACVAYRTAVLADNPFREDFFLYFEETELHARMRERGWRVVTVDDAVASQSTGGMPTYWGCRNVVLFQRAHGTRWSRVAAPPYFTARMMGIAALERDWTGLVAAPRGLLAGLRHRVEPQGGAA